MKRILPIVVAALLTASPAFAAKYAAGPHISTLGAGLGVQFKAADRLVVRVAASAFSASFGKALRNVTWDMELELRALGAALEYHPNDDGMLLSVGYFRNDNGMRLHAQPTADVRIGGRTFTPAEVGTLDGDLSYNRFALYLGIGYDNTFRTRGRWSFGFRAGILFMGPAGVTLVSDGALANDPGFLADLDSEADSMEGILNVFRYYPVISLGARYRF